MGTVLAFFLGYVVVFSSAPGCLLLLALSGFSIYVAGIAEKALGNKDDHRIVVDEIIGYFFSIAFLPFLSLPVRLAAFVLFRLFDVYKIPSKKVQNLQGGLGVMMDDILSGITANILLQIFLRIPWISARFF